MQVACKHTDYCIDLHKKCSKCRCNEKKSYFNQVDSRDSFIQWYHQAYAGTKDIDKRIVTKQDYLDYEYWLCEVKA